MKKIVSVVFTIALLFSMATAEIDLSSLSYKELVVLQQKISAEIVSRPEWKKVLVPAGTWKIGEDIPAGTYSITCADEYGASFRIYEDNINDYDFVAISGDSPLGKYTFPEGKTIYLNRAVIFAPPIVLGF